MLKGIFFSSGRLPLISNGLYRLARLSPFSSQKSHLVFFQNFVLKFIMLLTYKSFTSLFRLVVLKIMQLFLSFLHVLRLLARTATAQLCKPWKYLLDWCTIQRKALQHLHLCILNLTPVKQTRLTSCSSNGVSSLLSKTGAIFIVSRLTLAFLSSSNVGYISLLN